MAWHCNGIEDCDLCRKGHNKDCEEWIECDECKNEITEDYFTVDDKDLCLDCIQELYGKKFPW